MASILAAGPPGLAGRTLVDRLVAAMRSAGHDAIRHGTSEERPTTAVQEADAVVAVLDGAAPAAIAAAAYARSLGKPVLGFAGAPVDPLVADLCTTFVAAADEAEALAALPAFYEEVRPFAGRLVRDLVPRLVKEAGHDVTFRALTDEEKPRFLKQKVVEEAQDLLSSDRGDEPEEISDVLEALETLIRARGFAREDLRRVKEHKHKRRGGFDKGFVVESTSTKAERDADKADASPKAQPAREGPPSKPGAVKAATPAEREQTAARAPARATANKPAGRTEAVFEYPDAEPVPDAEDIPEVGPERRVEPRTFEL